MLTDQSSCVQERQDLSVLLFFLIQEVVEKVFVDVTTVFAPNGCLKQFVDIDRVEELFELAIEDLHLVLEVS